MQSDGAIEVALAKRTLNVKRFVMTSADTRLNVEGSVRLAGSRQLQLVATGSVNMALLQVLNPDLTSSGKADVDVRVAGTIPSLSSPAQFRSRTFPSQTLTYRPRWPI